MSDMKQGEDKGGEKKGLGEPQVEVVPGPVALDKVDRSQQPGQEEDQGGDDCRYNPHKGLLVEFTRLKKEIEEVSNSREDGQHADKGEASQEEPGLCHRHPSPLPFQQFGQVHANLVHQLFGRNGILNGHFPGSEQGRPKLFTLNLSAVDEALPDSTDHVDHKGDQVDQVADKDSIEVA